MKILAIGDFHGKFPLRLKRLAKEVDLIVSVGDYSPWRFKKIFFKHCYRKDMEIWEVVGKRKYKNGFLKDLKIGETILKFFGSIKTPVVTVVGNYDGHQVNDSYSNYKSKVSWQNHDFFNDAIKKYPHIKRIDYRAIRIGEMILIGAYGASSPGEVKSKAYRRYRKKLDSLFKKYRKENKKGKVIFVSHNVPYDTRLDKISDDGAPSIVRGKHYGSKMIRRIIDRYQPVLAIGGHMHENQGKSKLGKTIIINTGAAMDGKCAVIYFDEKIGKVKKVEFIN